MHPLEFQIIAIKLEGPNFTIVPTSIISQTVRNKKETTFTWIISPNKTGEQTVLINFSGMSEQLLDNMKGLNNAENIPFTYTIIVVDTLGIPTKPATILGYIASFLGATLTLPWWYSVWEKFQERKAKMQTQSSQGRVRKHDK